MNHEQVMAVSMALEEVRRERYRQHAKWGEQNYPDGTGGYGFRKRADSAKSNCANAFAVGMGTFRDILAEEVFEAFAESDPEKLRAELIQVAAVAVQWVEKLDRDRAKASASDALDRAALAREAGR